MAINFKSGQEFIRDVTRPLIVSLGAIFKAHTENKKNPHTVKFDQVMDYVSTAPPSDAVGQNGQWYCQLLPPS